MNYVTGEQVKYSLKRRDAGTTTSNGKSSRSSITAFIDAISRSVINSSAISSTDIGLIIDNSSKSTCLDKIY